MTTNDTPMPATPPAAAPAVTGEVARLAEEAKSYALAIFSNDSVRSDLRELNQRIDSLAALAPRQHAKPAAKVLFRQDEDGLEPVMFYGPGSEPDPVTLKERFVLRDVWLSAPTPAPAKRDAVPAKAGEVAAKLSAMAINYSRGHSWDYLDAEVCQQAAALLAQHPTVAASSAAEPSGEAAELFGEQRVPEAVLCLECNGDGEVLGSRSWLACASCHGSGRTDVLGKYKPGCCRVAHNLKPEFAALPTTLKAAPEAVPVDEVKRLVDAVREILGCPYEIEEATVPKTGLDTPGLNLYQVVGTMHVALPRYRALKSALAALATKHDTAPQALKAGDAQATVSEDARRLDWLDAACNEMLLEFGFEIDGGVYLRIDAPGHGGTDIREKNKVRDLIDSAMVVAPC